jgi:hypothetical protein
MLAERAGSIYSRSHPSNAGTKHLVACRRENVTRAMRPDRQPL